MTNFEDLDRLGQILQLMQAGDLGRQAYKAGHSRRDNPYPKHTELHKQWDTSFCQALHDDIHNILKPCSIFRVGDTVKHRDRPQNILHQYTGTVVSIEPTAHGCDYIGVEINNKVRFFMSTDLTH